MRIDTSMPTISSNCLSLSSSRSSLPSPQPRSSTRFAPLARSAARTAPSRCSLQAERLLQHLLGPVAGPLRRPLGLRRLLLLHQPGEGLAEEARLELQVAAGDLLLLRVAGQPAASLGQQLLQLVVADEVVLVVVEDRDQDVQVGQQLRERRDLARSSRRSTGSRPTPGTARRAGAAPPRPRSPAARTPPAGTARRPAPAGRRAGPPAGSASPPAPGRSLHRPWRAEPKTWEIATLRNDEAT